MLRLLTAVALLASVAAGAVWAAPTASTGAIVVAARDGAVKNGHFDLYRVDMASGAVTQLTNTPAFDEFAPSVSPDGSKVVFVGCACDIIGREAQAIEHSQLYVVDAHGGKPRQITHEKDALNLPSWSPDGKRILFDESRGGGFEHVYAVPATGGAAVRLTSSSQQDLSGSLSPDGTLLAVVRSEPGPGGSSSWLVVIRVSTGKATTALGGVSYYDVPSWSPDGAEIAVGRDSGKYQLNVWTVAPDGSHPVQVTRGGGDKHWPVWAPDGSRIAYVKLPRASDNYGATGTLTLVAPDGSGARTVGGLPSLVEQPDWGR